MHPHEINNIQYRQNLLKKQLDQSNVVLFYESNHYYLSNFSAFVVEWRDYAWPTSEHAYHGAKFNGDEAYSSAIGIREKILKARSAHEAMKIAQSCTVSMTDGWKARKLSVMKEILRHKLEQHRYIQRKLKQTLGMTLIEDSWRDSYWGRGKDWDGENHLGKLWMEVRDEYYN